jgi:hypothetical protein
MKNRIVPFFVFAIIAAGFYSFAMASETKHESFRYTTSTKKPFLLRLEIDAGKVDIRPGADDRDVELDFRYDEKKNEISVDFDEKNNELRVYFDVKRWFKDDDEDDKSNARLTVDLPTDVEIEMYCKTKAGETEIELGDLRIKDFTLRVLAGESFLAFSKPNRERMKEIKIESKIGELTVEKLGNANFEYATIDGNIGELSVDFSGDIEPEYDRDIEMSLNIGQTRLYLPQKDAIRIAVSKFLFLSDVEVPHDFFKEGKFFYSENYHDKKYKTQLSISPGLGTLDVRVR